MRVYDFVLFPFCKHYLLDNRRCEWKPREAESRAKGVRVKNYNSIVNVNKNKTTITTTNWSVDIISSSPHKLCDTNTIMNDKLLTKKI